MFPHHVSNFKPLHGCHRRLCDENLENNFNSLLILIQNIMMNIVRMRIHVGLYVGSPVKGYSSTWSWGAVNRAG